MKHLTLLAVICITSFMMSHTFGQASDLVTAEKTMQSCLDHFEQDDKRKYYIQEVVLSEGHSKDQLFDALRMWMSEHFKDENFVLNTDDKEAGILAGRGWTYFGVTADWPTVRMYYSVRIAVRDGKYRFRIFHVEFDDHASDDTASGMSTITDKINATYDENGQLELGAQYAFTSQALQSVIESEESLLNVDITGFLSVR